MSRNGTAAEASSVGCEATVRTRTSWFRARRGTSSTTSHWSGRRDSNSQPPASDAGALAVALRPGGYSRRGSNPHCQGSRPCASTGVGLGEQAGTDGRIRTDTGGGLSAVPLPRLGYVSRVDRAGVEPATVSLQGSCASFALPAQRWRGRESNPPGRDYEPPLISRSPARWGDRPDSNRLPPGPQPGVSTTSTSATVDEEGLEPPTSSL